MIVVLGVNFTEMAAPATLETTETDCGTVFKMTYNGNAYTYMLSHFELLRLNSNEVIIECITKIITEGKHMLGCSADK